MKKFFTTLTLTALTALSAMAQGWPSDYKGVMLQGFYWDSYSDTKWTNLEAQADELSKYFDLIWVPQSGYTGDGTSMGYNPLWWYRQDSSFGSEAELKSMIATFKSKGTGIIADVVINHRKGYTRWCDFPTETNPLDGKSYSMTNADVCSTDEYNTDSGAASERAKYGAATGAADTGDDFNGCRDLDHTGSNVQENCKAYTKYLLDYLGYAGFRYDMVKGFAAKYVGMYNASSAPTYSVGEYWDGTKSKVTSWISGTSTDGAVQSAAFDFPAKYLMTNNKSDYSKWYSATGALFSDAAYRRYAVTFVDNHDTYNRSDNASSMFHGDIIAANAWILAIPGTPCVFLPHWQSYKQEIASMISVRKAVGVSNTSTITLKRSSSSYLMCEVSGTGSNRLVVVIGDDTNTNITTYIANNYSGYQKVAGVSGKFAYYTNVEVPPSFMVDKATGAYYNNVEVTVSPVGSATLVYTTDGTTPTADNGTQISGSAATLTFTETTTLKVGILSNGAVTDIETYTYTVKAFEPYTITIYVNCPEWSPLYFWAWDSKGNLYTESWPGKKATQSIEKGGKTWYYDTFSITSSDYTVSFIFNNGSGKPQTVDITGINTDKYYTLGSLSGTKYSVNDVTDEYTSGIVNAVSDTRAAADGVRVYTIDGRMVRHVSGADGTAEALRGLAKGLYIVNNKKVLVK